MENVWEILGLEPTTDVSAIRRAYAKAARLYHPEEEPEKFRKVRDAYEQVLAWAKRGGEEAGLEGESVKEPIKKPVFHLPEEESEDVTACPDYPALAAFRTLYNDPDSRGNRKKWTDYFVSYDFLDVWREQRFTEALKKEVFSRLEENGPHKNFLRELSITYGIRYMGSRTEDWENGELEYRTVYSPVLLPEAGFDGIEHIVEITGTGYYVTSLAHAEERMRAAGFLDYMTLLGILHRGFDEEGMKAFRSVVGHYSTSYITDRPGNDRSPEWEIRFRHPLTLRLLNHFFMQKDIPGEAYRITWDVLGLEYAASGSRKRWYGELTETVKKQLPAAVLPDRDAMLSADGAFNRYRQHTFQRKSMECPEDVEEVDALFDREDFRYAILVPDFTEKVLNYWLDTRKTKYFLEKMKAFCLGRPESREAGQILHQVNSLLRKKEIEEENREDEETKMDGDISFHNRPFWRYFMTVAFPMAQPLDGDGINDMLMASWLLEELQPPVEWKKRFLGFEEESQTLPSPPAISLKLDGGEKESVLTVIFGMHHIVYEIDGELLWRPEFSWEWVKSIPMDNSLFFLLLPRAFAFYDKREEVRLELLGRLLEFPVPEEYKEGIAECLTGYLCTMREVENVVFCEKRETAERLYGYTVGRKGELMLFQEFPWGRKALPDGQEYLGNVEAACTEGKRRLEELTRVTDGVEMPVMERVPLWVEAQPERGAVIRIWGKDVTAEKIHPLISRFLKGELRRLELSFGEGLYAGYPENQNDIELEDMEPEKQPVTEKGPKPGSPLQSLVLVKEENKMLCLYFNDLLNCLYRYVSLPEVYYGGDYQEREEVDFGLGSVEHYVVHKSMARIRKMLPVALEELGRSGGSINTQRNWSVVPLRDKPLTYNRLKRELGGFPAYRARNHWQWAGIELPCRPDQLFYVEENGQEGQERGPVAKDLVLYHLGHCLKGQLRKLELVWRFRLKDELVETQTEWENRIVLLQEKGQFRMTCINGGKKYKYHLVADVPAYLDAEGKTPRSMFQGQKTENYLLHQTPDTVRDALDLLLPHIKSPERILNVFGEWCPEADV